MSTPAPAAPTDNASARPAPDARRRRSGRAVFLRWMISFPGFPLGGLAAMLLVGPVDSVRAALLGGMVTGTVLGAAQGIGRRLSLRGAAMWAAATAAGLGVGLAAGATAVGYGTELTDLVIQGLICGVAVGLAQSVVLARNEPRSHGRSRVWLVYVWPAYLSLAWALGWTLTTLVGVRVDDQFTVFGAAGAITVTALTSVLPLLHGRAD
ncbi:hypothetical protein FHX52_1094 [Humibacillus xanthopallidus]|uniref:Uncharacterized protein n=1 Tax=Humibacillus xanthopallidus TaxID=412689 RepID=A0A543PV65_9MICO|nr:hypothetical protein [Humibacillus xanthopallidus]TQN47973.1 hypothetical protein FHX52_1094 [Humibacillus xanthopallidus]